MKTVITDGIERFDITVTDMSHLFYSRFSGFSTEVYGIKSILSTKELVSFFLSSKGNLARQKKNSREESI